ncbi:MAG TPA: glutathione S-transferase [Rhizobiaceae bacterium]|nr:glutathione S-transferase [Rhizobiaceae bacterium]
MPKLLYSPTSPYSAKVRMAAAHTGVACEAVRTDTNAEPAELIDNNPLGKIPVWLTDDGEAIYDSVVIMRHIDRISGRALFPRAAERRIEAERLESLADGICDCLLAHVYERRFRPEEKIHQPWLDTQMRKVARGLDWLNTNPPRMAAGLNGGHFALAACLGYHDLRFGAGWRNGRPKLDHWLDHFTAKFPAFAELKPQG